jgi:hypothetical protein
MDISTMVFIIHQVSRFVTELYVVELFSLLLLLLLPPNTKVPLHYKRYSSIQFSFLIEKSVQYHYH